MSLSRLLPLVVLGYLLTAGCYPDPQTPPRWIGEILAELRCGMDLEQVQGLTEREVIDLEGGHFFLGGYRISTAWHDLWLLFDENGLQAVTWGVAEDSKNTRLSPRHDLCSGELSFLLRVSWTEEFVEAEVFLDDKLVTERERFPPHLVLSAGSHELRIEREGHPPVVRRLRLTPGDRGDQSLYLPE